MAAAAMAAAARAAVARAAVARAARVRAARAAAMAACLEAEHPLFVQQLVVRLVWRPLLVRPVLLLRYDAVLLVERAHLPLLPFAHLFQHQVVHPRRHLLSLHLTRRGVTERRTTGLVGLLGLPAERVAVQALRRTRRTRLALALLALHLLLDVLGQRLAKERPRVVLVVISALCGLRHPAHGLVHRVLHLTHVRTRHASRRAATCTQDATNVVIGRGACSGPRRISWVGLHAHDM